MKLSDQTEIFERIGRPDMGYSEYRVSNLSQRSIITLSHKDIEKAFKVDFLAKIQDIAINYGEDYEIVAEFIKMPHGFYLFSADFIFVGQNPKT